MERLRRIKLLRKLDVPLADIRAMLEGQCTLAEGMVSSWNVCTAAARTWTTRSASVSCSKGTRRPRSTGCGADTGASDRKEEQGVTFVNIEQVDRKAERIKGALVGAGLFTAVMLLSIGILAWVFFALDPQDMPPLPLLVVLFGIPAGCIVGTLKVLLDRIEEIGKGGEEDAYRNY